MGHSIVGHDSLVGSRCHEIFLDGTRFLTGFLLLTSIFSTGVTGTLKYLGSGVGGNGRIVVISSSRVSFF